MTGYDCWLDKDLDAYYEDFEEESLEDQDWKVDIMIEKNLEDYDE